MVREKDRLGVLDMSKSRHDNVHIMFGDIDNRLLEPRGLQDDQFDLVAQIEL